MNQKYEILRYRPEHRDQVIELQKHLWSSDSRRNSAYFAWKYEQNPFLNEILVYLAFLRGEIVGMRGLFGSKWEAGLPRQESLMFCADDLVISPEHRNRGLFTQMMNAALAELAATREGYALTLSGGLTTVLGSLTMGWKTIGTMQPVGLESKSPGKLQRLGASINTSIKKIPFFWRFAESHWIPAFAKEERFGQLDANARRSPRGEGSVWIEREAKPEAMAGLVAALHYDGRIRHVRDARYFAWRFRNPLHEYRFLYAGSSRLTGYLVLRRSLSDLHDRVRVHISDWEATEVNVAAALLRAAVSWGQFSRLATWTATLSNESRRILSQAGFVPFDVNLTARGCPCVLVRPLRPEKSEAGWTFAEKKLLDLSNWSLRMLYSMSG